MLRIEVDKSKRSPAVNSAERVIHSHSHNTSNTASLLRPVCQHEEQSPASGLAAVGDGREPARQPCRWTVSWSRDTDGGGPKGRKATCAAHRLASHGLFTKIHIACTRPRCLRDVHPARTFSLVRRAIIRLWRGRGAGGFRPRTLGGAVKPL